MSVSDAAHIYRIPESTIRRWVSAGVVAKHGIARQYQVDLADIEAQVRRRAGHGLAIQAE